MGDVSCVGGAHLVAAPPGEMARDESSFPLMSLIVADAEARLDRGVRPAHSLLDRKDMGEQLGRNRLAAMSRSGLL